MTRHQQAAPESTRSPAAKDLADLPVVRATPVENEDWDLEQDLEDEPELARYYGGLAEMDAAVAEAHRMLTESETDQ
jgi:hypothetical protein